MKRFSLLLTVLLAVLFSMSAFPAFAGSSANYAVLKLGAYSPQANSTAQLDNGTTLSGFEGSGSDFAGEIAVGRRFLPNFAAEFGIGRFSTDLKAQILGDITKDIWDTPMEIKATSLTATGKGILPLGRGNLFAGAGFGVYFASMDVTARTGDPGHPTLSASDDDTAYGFHLVGGGEYDVTETIFVGGELKYLWGTAKFSGSVGSASGTFDAKLDGFFSTVNVGYRF